jgi:uncharacterized phage-associated protein
VTPQPPAARSTLDIALWFQSRSESAGEALSQRKLHLLLYLAQAHYAAEHDGQKLMPAVFLALDAGPVEPNILQLFVSGRCSLTGNDPSFGLETFLHEVWARYGRKTGEQIAAAIARDGVWKAVLARGPRLEIPVEALFRGYGGVAKAVPAAERPAEAAGSSEPPRKEKEYWTLDGRRAQKWVPGVSRSTSPAPAVPDKKPGGGIRRIIPAPTRES